MVSLVKASSGTRSRYNYLVNRSIWNIIPVIVILLILPTPTEEGCDTQREILVILRKITLQKNRDYLIENENLQTNGSINIGNFNDINAIKAICKILRGDTNETLEEFDALYIKDCATMQKNSSFYCIRVNATNFDVFINYKANKKFSNQIMSLELQTDRNCTKRSNLITVPKIHESSEKNSTMSTKENNSTMITTGSHQNNSGWPWWYWVLITAAAVVVVVAVFSLFVLWRRHKQQSPETPVCSESVKYSEVQQSSDNTPDK